MSVSRDSVARSFARVRAYVASLESLATTKGDSDFEDRRTAALNGEVAKEVRRLLPLNIQRKFGAFFTGADLSSRLVSQSEHDEEAVYYDPACGMGDLLLAVARTLPLGRGIRETIRRWGSQLAGTDLHVEFIEGAKTRLFLLAMARHELQPAASLTLRSTDFPLIRVGDALKEKGLYSRATCVVMNPPYGKRALRTSCEWGSGKVTSAATFVAHAVESCRPGTQVLAILPEVLRSGTFSSAWRAFVSDRTAIEWIEPWELFDETADVHVFGVKLRLLGESEERCTWPIPRATSGPRLGDHFSVSVGPVVPHRHAKVGPSHPYIHPRCVPAWSTVKEFPESRRFEGRLFTPPFVVVRRTSRPDHSFRAVASVISGPAWVAIENHLLVCVPKDGTLKTCHALLSSLKSTDINDQLNARIRCRHLTVSALKDLQLPSSWRSP